MSTSSMRDFQILLKLGEGSFSVVYKVKRIQDQTDYALKKVKLPQLKEKERQNALNEVRLLASLDDEYIVAYKDAFIDDPSSSLCIVMELLSGGDLQKRITQVTLNQCPPFTENDIWRALVHMTKGLKTLHDAKVVHRDLKCANVFLSQDGKFKLGDLNVSKVAKMGLVYTQTGTPYYASPEVWRDEPYDSKSDIWSLGCVLYEMAALQPPFRAKDMDGLFQKVQKGVYDPLPGRFSRELGEVIASMLRVKSNQRPSCDQILNNGLVTRHVEQDLSEPPEQKAQLLKTIQLPRNVKALKEKLPKSKYTNTREKSIDRLDREPTQQGERFSNLSRSPERPKQDDNLKRVASASIQISHPAQPYKPAVHTSNNSVSQQKLQPQSHYSPPIKSQPYQPGQIQQSNYHSNPPPNNVTNSSSSTPNMITKQPYTPSHINNNQQPTYAGIQRPNQSPLVQKAIQQRPHSYNPINHQPQHRDVSPQGQSRIGQAALKQMMIQQPTEVTNQQPAKPMSVQVDYRGIPLLAKPASKVEGRVSSKVEQSNAYLARLIEGVNLPSPKEPGVFATPQMEPIKRKDPDVFPQQARVQPKKSSITESSPHLGNKAAGKPIRPLSSNIVPDHQINARQRQLNEYKPNFNIISNAPYNHYYPVEHLRSQLSDPSLQKQRNRTPVYMNDAKPHYKLSEVQKYQKR